MEHKKWNLDLAGAWELLMEDGTVLPGKLPGCSYLTLLDNKRIEDPFRGCNEKAASELAKQKYCYRREFSLSEAKLDGTQIELVLSGVDTLAAIFVNGKLAGRTENAFQTYRFGVAELLHQGINELRIDFDAPHSLLQRSRRNDLLRAWTSAFPVSRIFANHSTTSAGTGAPACRLPVSVEELRWKGIPWQGWIVLPYLRNMKTERFP